MMHHSCSHNSSLPKIVIQVQVLEPEGTSISVPQLAPYLLIRNQETVQLLLELDVLVIQDGDVSISLVNFIEN